jgi:hypothetical protein
MLTRHVLGYAEYISSSQLISWKIPAIKNTPPSKIIAFINFMPNVLINYFYNVEQSSAKRFNKTRGYFTAESPQAPYFLGLF